MTLKQEAIDPFAAVSSEEVDDVIHNKYAIHVPIRRRHSLHRHTLRKTEFPRFYPIRLFFHDNFITMLYRYRVDDFIPFF